jgi:signal transduction histidine kinase
MLDVHDRPRQLLITTDHGEDDHVWVSVRDAGVGVDPQQINKAGSRGPRNGPAG